ncbi:MAG: VOC family protein [Candidatus Yonathbacteria bacterium]|nr:VOC family protein [Candidatus Yonathbacteria bacterium]
MQIKELGHVVLYVTNIKTVADFYRDILGFTEIARDQHTALFSGGRTHHELLLIEVGGTTRKKEIEPGLYHIGFKVADTHKELKEVYRHLKKHNVTIIGTGDHAVTHSIYILDPDGNELELYADVSDVWKKDPKSIMALTKPLDLE